MYIKYTCTCNKTVVNNGSVFVSVDVELCVLDVDILIGSLLVSAQPKLDIVGSAFRQLLTEPGSTLAALLDGARAPLAVPEPICGGTSHVANKVIV